jgi:5-methylcytosine-specific restriction enzyme subunit McrC
VLRNSVALKQYGAADCIGRSYSRLNADYEIMHKLCRFFLEHTGPTHDAGNRGMLPFLVDMARLFELFVARWLGAHLDPRYTLTTKDKWYAGNNRELCMESDLLISDARSREPLCVLDTKYKLGDKVDNNDYYQVVTYANTIGCRHAILVYPTALAQGFRGDTGNIAVRTAIFDIAHDLDEGGKELLRTIYSVLEEQRHEVGSVLPSTPGSHP